MTDLFGNTMPSPTMTLPPKIARGAGRPSKTIDPIIHAAMTAGGGLGRAAAEGVDAVVELAELIFNVNAALIANGQQQMQASQMRAITNRWASRAGASGWGTNVSKTRINGAMGTFAKLGARFPMAWTTINAANAQLKARTVTRKSGSVEPFLTRLPTSHLDRLRLVADFMLANNFSTLSSAQIIFLVNPVPQPQSTAGQRLTNLKGTMLEIVSMAINEKDVAAMQVAQDVHDHIDSHGY